VNQPIDDHFDGIDWSINRVPRVVSTTGHSSQSHYELLRKSRNNEVDTVLADYSFHSQRQHDVVDTTCVDHRENIEPDMVNDLRD